MAVETLAFEPDPEPRCESQGCHCSPSLPCDEDLCDGQQYDDGSTVSCTMCVRECAEMIDPAPPAVTVAPDPWAPEGGYPAADLF